MYTRASLAIATFPRGEFPGRGLVTSLFAKEACTTAAYTRIASLAKRDAGATDAVIVTNAGATQASGIYYIQFNARATKQASGTRVEVCSLRSLD